jgi:hypothetical protein
VEIDYPHDLAAARAWIWPAIIALGPPPRRAGSAALESIVADVAAG